ncbi:MAG: hypothetical protein ACRKGH_08820 [Dehalogenimonas sp.]
MKRKAGIATVVYISLSLTGAALFLLATASGVYTAVERIGGAVWVFLLLMIVLMPAVTALVKKKS